MGLKLHPLQQLHENIQGEVHLTCIFLGAEETTEEIFSF